MPSATCVRRALRAPTAPRACSTTQGVRILRPVGWFSRTSSPKVPRWGFRVGWDDFVDALRDEARELGLELDEDSLAAGSLALPETARETEWNLRALAARCRELEPHDWQAEISRSLYAAFGRLPPPRDSGLPEANEFRSRLRVQVFGNDYVVATALATDRIAMKRFGDAWLVVVQDLVGGEATTTREALANDGITLDQAFELGRKLGVADTAPHAQTHTLATPGAVIELAVANTFYLSAMMLEAHARLPAETAVVACAVSWHHWVLATLERGTATRETLRAIGEIVANLRANISVTPAETIGGSLWWWPIGGEPEVFVPDGKLPDGLAAALAPS